MADLPGKYIEIDIDEQLSKDGVIRSGDVKDARRGGRRGDRFTEGCLFL